MGAALCLVLMGLISQSAPLAFPVAPVSWTDFKEVISPSAKNLLNHQNVADEHARYVFAYNWCISYNYCSQPTEKPEAIPVDEIKVAICEPVKAIKRFYNLDCSNCDLTKKLMDIMSKPRCAREDEETCKSDNCRRERRWARMGRNIWRNMPVTYRIKSPLNSPYFSIADQEALAQHCSRLWTENSRLRMQFLRNNVRANIEIEFIYIDGPWGTVGRGLSPSYTGFSYQRLDSSEIWKRDNKDPSQGVSMQWAFCHEMGHNLGLGHSRDMNAIMFPSGVGQDDSRLSSDDLQGIQALYGVPSHKEISYSAQPRQAPAPNPTPDRRRQWMGWW